MQLKRNSLFGMLGFGLPTLVILICYPVLLNGLGESAFGVFFLAVSLASMALLLDLGFNAATIKFVSEDYHQGKLELVAQDCAASIVFYLLIGALAALGVWVSAPWLCDVIGVDAAHMHSSIVAFRMAALQIPAILLVSVSVAIFKGLGLFHWSAMTLAISTTMTYGTAAIWVHAFGAGLIKAVTASMFSSYIVLIAVLVLLLGTLRSRNVSLSGGLAFVGCYKRMFRFGSVTAVNATISVVVTQMPKYLVGALMGPAAVTVYATAFAIASKVQALVDGATEVMFPFASATNDYARLKSIYLRFLLFSAVLAAMFLFPIAYFASDILSIWVGASVAAKAASLLQLFSLAAFLLALTSAPFHILNGLGLPHLNTWMQLSHLSVLCIVLLVGFSAFGVSLEVFGFAFVIANGVMCAMFLLVLHFKMSSIVR